MSATGNQRWRDGRDTYVPPATTIRTASYEVHPIAGDTAARDFVLRHHYSGTYPAARYRFGLFHRVTGLVGVAVFSHPVNDRVLTGTFAIGKAADAVELGRFVLDDSVEANGETWFLGRCFRLLRPEGLAGVVSFSDPLRRTNRYGEVVFGGHVGTIYQAFNAAYLGRGTPRALRVLPDGSVFSPRAAQKIRALEVGWEYAVRQLQRHGAGEFNPDDPAGWLNRWASAITVPVRHPGNHRYAWTIAKVNLLINPLPYPKGIP